MGTDGRADGRTDGRTNQQSYQRTKRVIEALCSRLKIDLFNIIGVWRGVSRGVEDGRRLPVCPSCRRATPKGESIVSKDHGHPLPYAHADKG
jgi:hypothetical protein